MGKVAIHGFGRIGRSITKVALKNNLFSPFSVSDIRDIPTFAALFEVDTNYGQFYSQVNGPDPGGTFQLRPGVDLLLYQRRKP